MGILIIGVTDSLTNRDTHTDSKHTLAHAVHAVHETDCGWHYYFDFLRPTTYS